MLIETFSLMEFNLAFLTLLTLSLLIRNCQQTLITSGDFQLRTLHFVIL